MLAMGERIRQLRLRRGLSQVELAKRVHCSDTYISKLEKGLYKSPGSRIVSALADVLGVSADELISGKGRIREGRPTYRVTPIPVGEERPPYEIVRELEAAIRRQEEDRPILVPVSDYPISAGAGAPAGAERIPYLPGPAERSHQFVGSEVVGACLEPRIMRGHKVVVDLSASPRPGDIVAAEEDGEQVIKLLERRGDTLYLVTLNGRPPVEVTERTRIVGVVKAAQYVP